MHCMLHSTESIVVVEYRREYESIFDSALANKSMNPGVLFDENKSEVEIFVRLSL
jgi:hypothetical protein